MTFDEFNQLRDQACILHKSQTGDDIVSLDAIFAAVAAAARRKPGPKPAENDLAPEWFAQALREQAGQSVTAGTFLVMAGHGADGIDTREVARWMREAGVQSQKKSGQTVFRL